MKEAAWGAWGRWKHFMEESEGKREEGPLPQGGAGAAGAYRFRVWGCLCCRPPREGLP